MPALAHTECKPRHPPVQISKQDLSPQPAKRSCNPIKGPGVSLSGHSHSGCIVCMRVLRGAGHVTVWVCVHMCVCARSRSTCGQVTLRPMTYLGQQRCMCVKTVCSFLTMKLSYQKRQNTAKLRRKNRQSERVTAHQPEHSAQQWP